MSRQHVANLEIEDLMILPTKITTVPLFCGKVLKFGRDKKSNDHSYSNPSISRNHMEIYSIAIDDGAEPLVVVRDLESGNGTFVNDMLLGCGSDIANTRVLDDQDVIDMKPFWRVKVTLLAKTREPLTTVQKKQIALFSHQYVVTDRVLGYGASTKVRLAYETKTKKQLACKIYDLKSMCEAHSYTEANAISRSIYLSHELDHSKVAALQRAYLNRDVLYVFEELATGGDLYSTLQQSPVLEELEVRYILFQIVRGVKYLHEKGIAHRDIKLENVLSMVCPKIGERIALTDFCHAGLVSEGPMTQMVGTSGWQAPEQYSPTREHGVAVDMWAVGIMAAQLLGGNLELKTLAKFENELSFKNPRPELSLDDLFGDIRSIRHRDIEPSGEDFIRRCLDFNPKTRMTAQEAWIHPWLTEPTEVRALFEEREANSERHWRSRSVRTGWLQNLPRVRDFPESGNKSSKNDDEVFAKSLYPASKQKSPYFQGKKRTASGEVKDFTSDNRDSEKAYSFALESKRIFDPIKKMSVKERIRKFGMGGHFKDMSIGGRAITLDRFLSPYPRRSDRNQAKLRLIDELRKNNSMFITRNISWTVKAAEQRVSQKHCHSEGANNDDNQVDCSHYKRRKLVYDPADGKPINFEDPWTPM